MLKSKMFKRICATAMAICLVAAMAIPASAATFSPRSTTGLRLNVLVGTIGQIANNKNVSTYAPSYDDTQNWYIWSGLDNGKSVKFIANPYNGYQYALDYFWGGSNPQNCDVYVRAGNSDGYIYQYSSVGDYVFVAQNYGYALTATSAATTGGYDVRWNTLFSSSWLSATAAPASCRWF